MKQILVLIFLLKNLNAFSQYYTSAFKASWEFSKAGTNKWYPAVVPGNIYTDLYRNKLIPDPFFADNEKQIQWIDSCDWIYRTTFKVKLNTTLPAVFSFEGLDTYADIYVNGKLIDSSNNMFCSKDVVLDESQQIINGLSIYFHSALKISDSIAASKLPLRLPDNNRVYARKAQYQFGWDWGPKFIGCGIWKPVHFSEQAVVRTTLPIPASVPMAKLIQQKDSFGTSFYFEKDGKPIYAKGANWIPANIFLPSITKADYRKLLIRAKQANMNMLRVWGGGIYEDDYFYDLCDSLGIIIWQDFMFACGMYPADKAFLQNVKEEAKYQINRLKRHPSIVLWCGNNEIDEAWHNWGWQEQFNLHGADSAKVWQDYKTLFEDSLKAWVNEFDGRRPYISSSPKYGWGNVKSFTEGDSHYWGLWWGLEPWETFETHTGRFVSEWGMQSMPNYSTVKTYVPRNDLNYNSPAVQWHQKANEGFKKLNFYVDKYFIDSAKLKNLSLEEYTYLTQCVQYYILKNVIATQRSQPQNMGTLMWQLNDCWPVTSWSITDYSRAPKAGWYAVREGFRDDIKQTTDKVYPKNIFLQKPAFTVKWLDANQFTIKADVDAKYVFIDLAPDTRMLSDNNFDLKAGETKKISLEGKYFSGVQLKAKIISLYDVLNK